MGKIYDPNQKRIILGSNWITTDNPLRTLVDQGLSSFAVGCFNNVPMTYPYTFYRQNARGSVYVIYFPFGGAQFLGIPQYSLLPNCGSRCSDDSYRINCLSAEDGFCCIATKNITDLCGRLK